MKRRFYIAILLALLLALAGCHSPRREAKRMVARAEALADTLPDSTARLIDSVLRMPVYFSERQRMDMALLQGEALFRDAPLDDDSFEDTAYRIATSPELEHAADHYAKKKQYAKAAHAALYSGYVQQHYNEKEAAMHSFKDAEQYGLLSNDSLTVARAEYRMGKMLYDNYSEKEALYMYNKADDMFGNRYEERAYTKNLEAVAHIVLKQFDNAEQCLSQSLIYAEQSHSPRARRKAINNYAVFYRLKGEHQQAINCLRLIENDSMLSDTDKVLLYLNLGKTYLIQGESDSAVSCFQRMEYILPKSNVKQETKIAAYGALSYFAENSGDVESALHYLKLRDENVEKVSDEIEQENLFSIQRKYDYESIQNSLNAKIIQRQRIILVFGVLLFCSFVVLFTLQYRQKQLLESEKEMRRQIETMKHNLRQTVSTAVLDAEIATRLRLVLSVNRTIKHAKDPKNEWKPLVKQVMNGKESPFEAAQVAIETAYPNLYQAILEKYPNLTETEAKVCLLSYSDLSNAEMAEILGLRLNTINQNRSTLRRKLNLNSDKMKEQLRNRLTN